MKTISLAMIVKPDPSEAPLLDRCLESASKHVDEICVTITGSDDDVRKVAEKHGAKISEFEWTGSFAEARNYNFSQAGCDYVIWLDADDVLVHGENLKGIVDGMEEGGVKAAAAWYKYHFNKWGDCIVQHKKTRIIKNDGSFTWGTHLGELHEDLQPVYDSVRITFLDEDQGNMFVEVHHRTDDMRIARNADRNLELSKSQVRKYPEDGRAWWNLANSSVATGNYGEAMDAFNKFIKITGSSEELYLAYHRMAGICFQRMEHERGFYYEFKAALLRPHYPDAWVGIGSGFYSLRDYRKAKEFLVTGMTKDRPDSIIVFNPQDYDSNPLKLLANCYFQLGDPNRALKVMKKIETLFPNDEETAELRSKLEEKVDELERVNEFLERVKDMSNDEFDEEIGNLGSMRLHPKVCAEYNKRHRREEAPGNEIAVYCGCTAEEFDSSSLDSGIGGSEEAIIRLGRIWVDMGYRVVVYNNCGSQEKDCGDGILWRPYWTFNPRSNYDNVVVWRQPHILDTKLDAKRVILDLHDVMSDSEFTRDRMDNVDKVMVKTRYHASLFPSIPRDKIEVIGNGVDLEQFRGLREELSGDRIPTDLIYTSSPDRGLEHLLDRWERLKREVPDARLHVCYGWKVFDSMHLDNPAMMEWKKSMQEKMNREGIVDWGRLGQDEVAKKMVTSGIFAYPCHFQEIFCISAVKAQAAGCKVVAVDDFSFPEVVKSGILTDGDKSHESTWDEWLDVLIGVLSGRVDLQKPELGSVSEFSWDSIAKSWTSKFA